MAILNTTIVNGLIDAFDGYYITEQKRNLATISNNILSIGDKTFTTKIVGDSIQFDSNRGVSLGSSSGALNFNTNTGQVNISGAEVNISSKQNEGGYFAPHKTKINSYGNIEMSSINGGSSLSVKDDILNESSSGKWSLKTERDIELTGNAGKFSVNVDKDISIRSRNGAYSLNVSGDITETTRGSRSFTSTNGGSINETIGGNRTFNTTGGSISFNSTYNDSDYIVNVNRNITETGSRGNKTTTIGGSIIETSGGNRVYSGNGNIEFNGGQSTGYYLLNIYGDISETSINGKKNTTVKSDIIETSTNGSKTTTVNGDITEIVPNGGNGGRSFTTPRGDITFTTNNGEYRLNASGNIINTSSIGGYTVNTNSNIIFNSTNGAMSLTTKSGISENITTSGNRYFYTQAGNITFETASAGKLMIKSTKANWTVDAVGNTTYNTSSNLSISSGGNSTFTTEGSIDVESTGEGKNINIKSTGANSAIYARATNGITAITENNDLHLQSMNNNINILGVNGTLKILTKYGNISTTEPTDDKPSELNIYTPGLLCNKGNSISNYSINSIYNESGNGYSVHEKGTGANNGISILTDYGNINMKATDGNINITGNSFSYNIKNAMNIESKVLKIDCLNKNGYSSFNKNYTNYIAMSGSFALETMGAGGNIDINSNNANVSIHSNGSIEFTANGRSSKGIKIHDLFGDTSFDSANGFTFTGAERYSSETSNIKGWTVFMKYGDINETAENGNKNLNIKKDYVETIGKNKTTVAGTGITEIVTEGNKNIIIENGGLTAETQTDGGPISLKSAGGIDITSKMNMYRTSTEGLIYDKSSNNYLVDAEENIIFKSTNGNISITTNGEVNASAGHPTIYSTFGSYNGRTRIVAYDYLELNTNRIKIANSPTLYSTVEPSELTILNKEEGMLYFKLLD